MSKYNSFNNQKNKIKYLTNLQNQNEISIEQKKEIPLISLPCDTHYKSARLLYDSDWYIPEIEAISSAISQTKGTILPEKALYNLELNLNLTEQFLPYLKIEVIARTTPTTRIAGVYSYQSTGKREISFQLYDWLGITYTSAPFPCNAPQPLDSYIYTPPFTNSPRQTVPYYTFAYQYLNLPVPIGDDPSYYLPTARKYIAPNLLDYLQCGSPTPAPSGWNPGSNKTFWELIGLQGGLAQAKAVLDIYDNIVFSDELPNYKGHVADIDALPLTGNTRSDFYIQDNVAIYRVWTSDESEGTIDNWTSAGASTPKAFQDILTDELISAKQTKKLTKINDTQYNLILDGYVLVLSEAHEYASWSDLITPTYVPASEDIELRVKIYLENPTSYNESKAY